jgi:APA family basic amino acid/polyamine antiporter
MILGVSTVTVIYVLATAVYLYLVSAPDFIEIGRLGAAAPAPIAAAAAKAFAGETGAKLISAAVMVSTFGTVNAFILTSPRIFYAAAEDRLFPALFRRLDPTTNTPSTAIIVQGIWAGLIVCLARLAPDAYTAIVGAVVFAIWFFYIPTIFGYFRLRMRRPDIPRPYRTTFYPVTPIVFLIAGLLVVGSTFYTNVAGIIKGTATADLPAIWGLLVIAIGALVLWIRIRMGEQGKAEKFPDDSTGVSVT